MPTNSFKKTFKLNKNQAIQLINLFEEPSQNNKHQNKKHQNKKHQINQPVKNLIYKDEINKIMNSFLNK